MDTSIMQQLEFQYHATRAADPDYEGMLWDFCRAWGCTADDIWEYSPQIGYDAGQSEPEWM